MNFDILKMLDYLPLDWRLFLFGLITGFFIGYYTHKFTSDIRFVYKEICPIINKRVKIIIDHRQPNTKITNCKYQSANGRCTKSNDKCLCLPNINF